MQVGIVTTWFERGAAIVSKQYANAIGNDHNVFIYARSGEKYGLGDPNWDLPNVTWDPGRGVPVGSYLSIRTLSKWIKTNNIEMIIWNEQQWFLPVVAARSLGVINVAYVDYYTEETIPLFEIYDHLICNTQRHMSAFAWHQGAVYSAWGTDVGMYAPTHASHSDVVFFHSAGMSPYRKGTDILVNAFDQASLSNDNIRLVVHTQTCLFSAFPQISEILNGLIEKNKLTIVNKTVGAPGLYQVGDVYVYPSRLEGIGLTIAEALASGLPLIVPDEGPMNEFVINEDVGLKVPVERAFARSDSYYWPLVEVNAGGVAQAMLKISKDKGRLESMKLAARKCAEQHFDWNKNSLHLARLVSEFGIRPIRPEIFGRVIEYSNRLHPLLGTSVLAFMLLRKFNERLSQFGSWVSNRRFTKV